MSFRRLLLIDSDPGFHRLLYDQLAPYGFEIYVVDESPDPLSEVREVGPELIFIAVETPDKVGYSLCNRAKKGVARDIPVVLTTASVPPSGFNSHRKLKVHADEYLDKRVMTTDELVQKIDALVGLGAPVVAPNQAWQGDAEGYDPAAASAPVADAPVAEAPVADAAVDDFEEAESTHIASPGFLGELEAETDAAFAALGASRAPAPALDDDPALDSAPYAGPAPSFGSRATQPVAEAPAASEAGGTDAGRSQNGEHTAAEEFSHLDELDLDLEVDVEDDEGEVAGDFADAEPPTNASVPRELEHAVAQPALDDRPAAPDAAALNGAGHEAPTPVADVGAEPASAGAAPATDPDADPERLGPDTGVADDVVELGDLELEPHGDDPSGGDDEPVAAPAQPAGEPVHAAPDAPEPGDGSPDPGGGQGASAEAGLDLGLDDVAELASSEKTGDVEPLSGARIQELERENEELRAEVARLQKASGEGGSPFSREREFLELREVINKKEREVLNLQDELGQRERDVLEAKDKLRKHERERADIDAKVLELEQRLLQANEQTSTVEQELAGERQRAERFEAELSEARGEIASQKQEHARALEAQRAELDSERQAAVDEVKAQRDRELAEAEDKRKRELEAAASDKKAAIEALESEHREALDKRDRDHRAELEAAEERHAGHIARLERESKEALEEAEARREKELERAAGERSEAEATLKRQFGEERDELLAQIESEQGKVERLENELASAHETRQARDATIGKLQGEISGLEEQIRGLQEQVLKAHQRIEADEDVVARARKAMAVAVSILDDAPGPDSRDGTGSDDR